MGAGHNCASGTRRLRREKTPVSVAAGARRAGVSRTSIYTNPDAKTAVSKAIRETADQRRRMLAEADDAREATWRERALNAENALKAAHAEIRAQRFRIGELLGRIRDLEAEWTQDAVERITTPRTPPSNSACANSPPTTAHSTNVSQPPGPTCGSKTVELPTWKRG